MLELSALKAVVTGGYSDQANRANLPDDINSLCDKLFLAISKTQGPYQLFTQGLYDPSLSKYKVIPAKSGQTHSLVVRFQEKESVAISKMNLFMQASESLPNDLKTLMREAYNKDDLELFLQIADKFIDTYPNKDFFKSLFLPILTEMVGENDQIDLEYSNFLCWKICGFIIAAIDAKHFEEERSFCFLGEKKIAISEDVIEVFTYVQYLQNMALNDILGIPATYQDSKESILSAAAFCGREEMVDHVLQSYPMSFEEREFALKWAFCQGHLPIWERLLDGDFVSEEEKKDFFSYGFIDFLIKGASDKNVLFLQKFKEQKVLRLSNRALKKLLKKAVKHQQFTLFGFIMDEIKELFASQYANLFFESEFLLVAVCHPEVGLEKPGDPNEIIRVSRELLFDGFHEAVDLGDLEVIQSFFSSDMVKENDLEFCQAAWERAAVNGHYHLVEYLFSMIQNHGQIIEAGKQKIYTEIGKLAQTSPSLLFQDAVERAIKQLSDEESQVLAIQPTQ